PDHQAGDLQGPLVGEPRGDPDLGVGHTHDLALVLGDQHDPVVGLHGGAVLLRVLVVETRARGAHPRVALRPIVPLHPVPECREVLRARLANLHVCLTSSPLAATLRFTTRAGLPTATEYGGMSPFTTVCAPITEPSPIVAPRSTDTFSP